ncbi:DoxX family membrane protein [Actinokineospora bangkokensis]|uniref:DoxX family protein n=1 Tax=Actinokineospora bangkokensis TaxID=1193682 RepID=A0A1Q9LPV1_9PSEU|nr:hypothetical protein BJP25_13635 [Actinokineospora bangkokensis]
MILRRIARPMLAGIFISGGIAALRHPEAHVEMTKPLLTDALDKVGPKLPEQVPTDALTLVKVDGAVKVGAGVLLALGKFPRLAALLLSGSLVPTTVAGHRFWEEKDPQRRQEQQIHFFKNISLLGGLLLASADTAGKPSVAWRAKRAGRKLGRTAQDFGAWTADTTESVTEAVTRAPKQVGSQVGSAADKAQKAVGQAQKSAAKAAAKAQKRARKALAETLPG